MNMEKIQYLFSRILLLGVYLIYFFIAFAVNIDRIEDKLNITEPLKQKTVNIVPLLYSGAFQNEKNMLTVIKKHKIRRIISLMDPRIPMYNELNEYQKSFCKKYDLEFMNIPLANINKRKSKIDMIIYVVNNKRVPTYINGYLDDRNIRSIIRARIYDDKQNR